MKQYKNEEKSLVIKEMKILAVKNGDFRETEYKSLIDDMKKDSIIAHVYDNEAKLTG